MKDHPKQERANLDAESEQKISASPHEKLAALRQGVSHELQHKAQARSSQSPTMDRRAQTIRDLQTAERLGAARKRLQKAMEGHEDASSALQEQSLAAESETREKQDIVSSQTANLEKVKSKEFSKSHLSNLEPDNFPKLNQRPIDHVSIEVATPLGFASIDAKVIQVAAEIFPNDSFDLANLAQPDTQFKTAVLDALISAIQKFNMPGISTFRDLILKDQRQMIRNALKILPHLNEGLKPGADFTLAALKKSVEAYLEIEQQFFQPRNEALFRPMKLVDEGGRILDRTIWKNLKAIFSEP